MEQSREFVVFPMVASMSQLEVFFCLLLIYNHLNQEILRNVLLSSFLCMTVLHPQKNATWTC